MIMALHHVQIAMPAGGEAEARRFYGGVLGLGEVEKPDALRARGGVWFEMGETRVHLGVAHPHVAARKAHPAFEVRSLEAAMAKLQAMVVAWEADIDLPGMRRIYVADPFGNRIELLERPGAQPAPSSSV